MPRAIDLTGKRFGRLIVIGFSHRDQHKNKLWYCRCDCGNESIVRGGNLVSGGSTSCGCYRRERRTKHGHSKRGKISPEYHAWQAIFQRCTNPNDVQWYLYGERGISICEGWHEFKNFFADLRKRPNRSYSIDRIDNDGNYSCGHCPECTKNEWVANCRWATKKQQSRNRRNNHLIVYKGQTKTVAGWAEYSGLEYRTLLSRIEFGWSIEDAIEKPLQR